MQAFIFEGGEGVDRSNSIDLPEWSIDAITEAFGEYLGIDWSMSETSQILSDNLAQSVTCSVDGGMTYIVRA